MMAPYIRFQKGHLYDCPNPEPAEMFEDRVGLLTLAIDGYKKGKESPKTPVDLCHFLQATAGNLEEHYNAWVKFCLAS